MGYIILGVLGLLVAVLLLRAILFVPKKQSVSDTAPVEFDREKAISALQQLVRCRTVSYYDTSL